MECTPASQRKPARARLLECRDVSFAYNGRTVLDGINLTIDEGDFVGVIGPNGAGKSTLIKIMSGLLSPLEGVVTLNGADLASLSKRMIAREIAVIEQEEIPDFGFSVIEQVMMGRAPHHGGLHFEGRADRIIAQEAMSKTRVDHLADRRIEALSGGERQKVRIARALAQQPRLLFFDEPTNHLDLYSQLSLMELMKEIRSEGPAILMVSHDINFVAASSTHLKILHKGQFLSQGSPHEVITADNLAAAFHIEALVDVNPVTQEPRITPVARLKDPIES